MVKQEFDINNLRVASPCPVSWETMKGDERTRYCGLCSLNVYNLSEMTRTEAESLIAGSEGRICARIYRRADGTVITRDCPVGLKAYRKRIATFAGAALSMVLGLFSIGYSQCKVKTGKNVISASKLNIDKQPNPAGESKLFGRVVDQNGAVVPKVEIFIFGKSPDKIQSVTSDEKGLYSFATLKPGLYSIAIKATPGFKNMGIKDLNIEPGFTSELNVVLEAGEVNVTVGVVGESPLIDFSSSDKTTVITREMIERMP